MQPVTGKCAAENIDLNTHWAVKEILDVRRDLAEISLDKDKEGRHASHQCPTCYYMRRRGMIVGHGFTSYKCQECGGEAVHRNTGVPRLCPKCCEEHGVCGWCGADIDFQPRATKDALNFKGDAVSQLCDILTTANAQVTFDAERDLSLPCFSCAGSDELRYLMKLRFRSGRVVTRPFCKTCIKAKTHRRVKEAEVDARTIRRLKGLLRKAWDKIEQLETKR